MLILPVLNLHVRFYCLFFVDHHTQLGILCCPVVCLTSTARYVLLITFYFTFISVKSNDTETINKKE